MELPLLIGGVNQSVQADIDDRLSKSLGGVVTANANIETAGYQVVNCGGAIVGSNSLTITASAIYFDLTIDSGTLQSVGIYGVGTYTHTYDQWIALLNTKITDSVASIDAGNIKITSNSTGVGSAVAITNYAAGNFFPSFAGYVGVNAAVAGEVTSKAAAVTFEHPISVDGLLLTSETLSILVAVDTLENLTANYSATTNDGKYAKATNLGLSGEIVVARGGNWRPVAAVSVLVSGSTGLIFAGFSGATYSQVGTTVTVTWTGKAPLDELNGWKVYLPAGTGSLLSRWYTNYTYVDANTFTCTSSVSQTTSGNLGTNTAETFFPNEAMTSTTLWTIPDTLVSAGDSFNCNFVRRAGGGAGTKTLKFYLAGTTADIVNAATTSLIWGAVSNTGNTYVSNNKFIWNNASGAYVTEVNKTMKASMTLSSSAEWCAVRVRSINAVWNGA